MIESWDRAQGWLYSDTPEGVTGNAPIYSLVETAKVIGQDLIHGCVIYWSSCRMHDYEALLPWNCSREKPQ